MSKLITLDHLKYFKEIVDRVVSTRAHDLYESLGSKQEKLTIGNGIKIENGVISVDMDYIKQNIN